MTTAPTIPGPETPAEFAAKVHLCSQEDVQNAYAAFDCLVNGDTMDTLNRFAGRDLSTEEIFAIIYQHLPEEMKKGINACKVMCMAIECAKRKTRLS